MTLAQDWSPSSAADHSIRAAIEQAEAREEAVGRLVAEHIEVTEGALLWGSYAYFLSKLKDDKGQYLIVRWHNRQWCNLLQDERLLCLMAARDHGKTFVCYGYIAWRMWKHNRGPDGYLLAAFPEGDLEVMYFTSVIDIAKQRFERIKQLLIDNEQFFGDLLPVRVKGQQQAVIKDVWTTTKIRLRNHSTLWPKSIGSSMRGPHPQLIVADDVVTEKNGRTPLQRGRVWSYIVSTLLPMAGATGQLIVVGTPQHYEDALHKLRGKPGWAWVKARALNPDTDEVLWEERYSRQYLSDLQKLDPVLFSREYQMDPRDDATSIFPWELTGKSLMGGEGLTFIRPYPGTRREAGEAVVGGMDLAISETAGADYTVIWLATYNRLTGRRRLLWACRLRGLTFDEQVNLCRQVCKDFWPEVLVIEANTFQKWLAQELMKYPETSPRVYAHTTGIEKQNLIEGVPGLKLSLTNDLWLIPSGDAESAEFASIWRQEANAFGYADGKLESVGEHDDTVMAWWLCERGVRMLEVNAPRPGEQAIVTAEEIDDEFERVRIGSAY